MASIMHNVNKKMKNWSVVIMVNILLLVTSAALAQRNSRAEVLAVSAAPEVDGNLNDWVGGLTRSFSAQDMQYELAQDGAYLYVSVRISDFDRQIQALTRGVQFMVNAEGRKRAGQALIFPVLDRIGFRALMNPEEGMEPMEMRQAALESVRSIRVSALTHLPDGPIALVNDFGIAAAARLDENDNLCVEMRMPLNLWGTPSLLSGKTLAYQLKIMEVPAPTSMTTGRTRSEPGHWGQFTLELN